MKETGITFTDESMVAILAGRKTQTRRLAKQLARGGYQHRFGGVGDQRLQAELGRIEASISALPVYQQPAAE